MSKIAIITCHSENMRSVADLTVPSHKAFADAWGCDHEARVVPQEECLWAKLNMVSEYLETHELVWWLDTDALVTESRPEGHPHPPAVDHVIATADINGLNAGVFAAYSSPRTMRFFHACRTYGKVLFGDRPDADQQTMRYFSLDHPYKGIIEYVTQRAMNSYWPGAYEYPGCEAAWWEPGDFILHLPGLPNERRVEILNEASTMLGTRSPSPESGG